MHCYPSVNIEPSLPSPPAKLPESLPTGPSLVLLDAEYNRPQHMEVRMANHSKVALFFNGVLMFRVRQWWGCKIRVS